LAGSDVDLAADGIYDEPMDGCFVGVAEIDTVLVQPPPHIRLANEVQVQPVVATAARIALAIVVARLVAARLPEEGNELAPASVTKSRQKARWQSEWSFQDHVFIPLWFIALSLWVFH
jgi:hypothetical protein